MTFLIKVNLMKVNKNFMYSILFMFLLGKVLYAKDYSLQTDSKKQLNHSTKKVANSKKKFIQTALFSYENDSVYGPDRYYTNGIQFLFVTVDNSIMSENEYLSKIFNINTKIYHNFSFGIGQKIYTPYTIKIAEPVLNDRPYAGYLYLFLNKNIRYDNKLDSFGISVGLTGPSSLAEITQKRVHELIGSTEPKGWNNQLKNELLVMFSWMRNVELNKPKQNSFDWNVIPKFTTNIGTPLTSVVTSIEFRYGWNLADDFNSNKMQALSSGIRNNFKNNSSKNISYYVFFEAEGNFIFYDTFLDGNLSGKKTNIEKELFRYELIGGLTLNIENYYIKYSNIFMSKEFKEQKDNQFIFSLTMGYLF